MIILGVSMAKPRTKNPPTIGCTSPTKGKFVTIINNKGEIIREWRATTGGIAWKTADKPEPRWLINPGDLVEPETILIDLKNKQLYTEPTIAYHPALKIPHITTTPPIFRPEYRKLRKYGGIYQYPEETTTLIVRQMVAAAGEPLTYSATISNNEKQAMISARGEARIYRLPKMELIDIMTWAQIMRSLTKAGTPRKLLRLIRLFDILMDPEKPNTAWVLGLCGLGRVACIFRIDIPTREVISEVKHIYDIVWENGLDEEFKPIRLLDKEKIYDIEYMRGIAKASWGIWGDGKLNLGIGIITEKLDAPKDPREREKMGLVPNPLEDDEMIRVTLDKDLGVECYKRWITIGDKEYHIWVDVGGVTTRWNDQIITGSLYARHLSDNGKTKLFNGIVRLGRRYETINAVELIPIENKFEEEVEIEEKKKQYKIDITSSGGGVSRDGGEVLAWISVDGVGPYRRLVQGRSYLVRTDWKIGKLDVVGVWLGEKKNDTPYLDWCAWL